MLQNAKNVYWSLDVKVKRVERFVLKQIQKLNCHLIKRNHKFLVHNHTCLRCGKVSDNSEY